MGSLDDEKVIETSVINEFKALDLEEFRKQAYQTIDFIIDYYKNIESYPVLSQVETGYLLNSLPSTPPCKPESFENILKDVQTQIIPGMTNWLSPNFFAYFPATVSTAGFMGEMLSTCFNSVGFTWLASPAATELEMVVMDWFADMLKLPSIFKFSGSGGGVIQGTTSEAILCTLIAARDRALDRIGDSNIAKLVVYGSDQTHSTFVKACKIAGILPCNIRSLPTTLDMDFSLSPALVRATVETDVTNGFVPIYLCLTVGTTSSNATDQIDQFTNIASDHGIWVHVDAAYAGSACICPEFRHFLNGIEGVDSFSLSPHKWFLTYLECCCLWVKKPSLLIRALSTNPEYLKNKPSESNLVTDYKDWQVGTGRKFRSLKLWLILRSYGVENLQSHIRSDIRMAEMFEDFVRKDSQFEIVVPRRFALVCFRWNPDSGFVPAGYNVELLNRKLLDWINSTGQVYMTHTIIGGVYIMRFAIGATLTEESHVIAAWNLIKEGADTLLVNKTSRSVN
ncbi:hypothetical protein MKW92_022143 [Papaver armeniacum]|nr:hypothetical protein MKW92_022143 [Papaver armeniacum]